MSREVNVYTKGGGGSIGLVPGVVPAAWGGPGRAQGAVRAAPKIKNCGTTRVNSGFSAPDSPKCPLGPYNKDTSKIKVGWAQHGLSKWVLAHILT